MATVEFDHIYKVYDNNTSAVKDLCLKIADGEFLVFVGPSGCGKSTVMRMLAGLESISAGRLLIDGETVNERSPQQRNVAMVFQNYALYPHMTVKQNLEFPLKMAKTSKGEMKQRVHAAADKLGLTPLLHRKPKQLSGGQRQRVAMGRAIVRDPAVFLMDEPLSNLDAKMRVQIRTEIATLQRKLQTTMVYVTHDQIEAMTMGDRVAVLRQGELQQVSTPQQLYTQPANIFVASFIGSPAMNIFASRLTKTDDGEYTIGFGNQQLILDRALLQQYPQLGNYLHQPIIAGLRPEAFSLATETTQATIETTVETVEALGHEMMIYFDTPVELITISDHGEALIQRHGDVEDQLMVARIDATRSIRRGDRLPVAIDTSKLYLFSTEGRALFH